MELPTYKYPYTSRLFECYEEGCVKKFLYQGNLVNHLTVGKYKELHSKKFPSCRKPTKKGFRELRNSNSFSRVIGKLSGFLKTKNRFPNRFKFPIVTNSETQQGFRVSKTDNFLGKLFMFPNLFP